MLLLLWFRTACKLRLVSYDSCHTSQSLFDMLFCMYLHAYPENYRLCTNILQIKWLLCYRRLELRAKYNWQVMAPNTNSSLIHHLCILTCITCYIDILHMTWLLYYRRHSFCSLELHEKSDWRTVVPDTHHGCSVIQHCVHTASLYIHMYVSICAQVWTTTKFT